MIGKPCIITREVRDKEVLSQLSIPEMASNRIMSSMGRKSAKLDKPRREKGKEPHLTVCTFRRT